MTLDLTLHVVLPLVPHPGDEVIVRTGRTMRAGRYVSRVGPRARISLWSRSNSTWEAPRWYASRNIIAIARRRCVGALPASRTADAVSQ